MSVAVQEPLIQFTYLPEGYTSSVVEHREMSWSDFEDFFLVVHLVAGKDVTPCILPCTIKASRRSSSRRTKTGRRRVTDAETAHLLIGDIDHGNLDLHVLEAAVAHDDVAAILYPTWKSGGVHGQRWRVITYLSEPIKARDYKDTWIGWARSVERRLTAMGEPRPERGWFDWSGRTVTLPAILPCRPSGSSEDWGGTIPRVVIDEGRGIQASDLVRARARSKGSTGRRRRFNCSDGPNPYLGNPDAENAAQALAKMGNKKVPKLIDSMDAVALARRDGITAEVGRRHASLSGCCFALFRVGYAAEEITSMLEAVVEATPRYPRLLHDAGQLEAHFGKRARIEDEPVEELVGVVVDALDVPEEQLGALTRYARVLCRQRGLRSPRGGAINHGDLARVLGVDVRAVTAWRGAMERAGLVESTGEKQGRRYRLLVAADAEPEAEVDNDFEDVLDDEMRRAGK